MPNRKYEQEWLDGVPAEQTSGFRPHVEHVRRWPARSDRLGREVEKVVADAERRYGFKAKGQR